MIKERKINDVIINVDTSQANAIYFKREFAKKLKNNGLPEILKSIYENKPTEFIPESLMLELTNVCNFSCEFCYIHTCKVTKKHHIKFKSIKKDIDYLIKNGLISCNITGGECLSHPDFLEIYKYLKENGVLVSVLTNLSLLNDSHLKIFKEYPPYKVDVSVYGFSNESMQEITSQDIYTNDNIFNNIILLKKAGIRVTCKTPINKLTEYEVPLIKKWCIENKIEYFSSPEIFPNYDGKSMDDFSVSEEIKDKDIVDSAKDKFGETYRKFEKKINFDCKGGEYGIFISHDYVLRPCMAFYGIGEANFPIDEEGIEKSLSQLKYFVQKYKGTTLKFCTGCNKISMCKECLVSQLRYKNNFESYMQQNCKKVDALD